MEHPPPRPASPRSVGQGQPGGLPTAPRAGTHLLLDLVALVAGQPLAGLLQLCKAPRPSAPAPPAPGTAPPLTGARGSGRAPPSALPSSPGVRPIPRSPGVDVRPIPPPRPAPPRAADSTGPPPSPSPPPFPRSRAAARPRHSLVPERWPATVPEARGHRRPRSRRSLGRFMAPRSGRRPTWKAALLPPPAGGRCRKAKRPFLA